MKLNIDLGKYVITGTKHDLILSERGIIKARRVYGRTGTRGIRGVERRHFIVVRERLVLDAATGTAAGG